MKKLVVFTLSIIAVMIILKLSVSYSPDPIADNSDVEDADNAYLEELLSTNEPSEPCTSVTDCQGNTYPVAKIGDQYWMAEDLRCTKYDTKSEMAGYELLAYDTLRIAALKAAYKRLWKEYEHNTHFDYWGPCYSRINTKGYCLTSDQKSKIGLLYSWAAAVGFASEKEARRSEPTTDTNCRGCMPSIGPTEYKRQGICPNGWRIPSTHDFCILYEYVNNTNDITYRGDPNGNIAFHSLRSKNGWCSMSNGTDEFSFNATPNKWKDCASYWTNVGRGDSYAEKISFDGGIRLGSRYAEQKYVSLGVRCIRN